MVVVEFVGEAAELAVGSWRGSRLAIMVRAGRGVAIRPRRIGAGCRSCGCGGIALLGDKFYFANQGAAPGVIDAIAKIPGHLLELPLPRFGIGGDFQAAVLTLERVRVRGEGLADDLRPGTGEPDERGFGMIESARDASEKIASFVHEVDREQKVGILTQGRQRR